ncbi:MAG TPA: MarR family transcriptional regulator [Lacisediminihabitans sp.]|jgi:DNA-binding MarR family transcriptional regulator|nr:MarR family transcriptional regulator [Lacisediminihabitans sp.]HXD62864.1 MarR family transcriptional regulator [Lacisediminihabitans sp.]
MADLRQVFDDLVRYETLLWAAVDDRLQRDAGLSLGSFNVMLIIDSTPSCRVFDIAQALVITVGGSSQAVDRLEKSGWCIRKPHPTDRRSSIVELTAQGKELLARATPVFDDELERLLRAPLASSSLAQLATGLRTLRHSIGDRTEVTA